MYKAPGHAVGTRWLRDMTRWRLKCTECGREWILPVSFRLDEIGKLYHYCKYCKKNTFHVVLGEVVDETADTVGGEDPPHLSD